MPLAESQQGKASETSHLQVADELHALLQRGVQATRIIGVRALLLDSERGVGLGADEHHIRAFRLQVVQWRQIIAVRWVSIVNKTKGQLTVVQAPSKTTPSYLQELHEALQHSLPDRHARVQERPDVILSEQDRVATQHLQLQKHVIATHWPCGISVGDTVADILHTRARKLAIDPHACEVVVADLVATDLGGVITRSIT